MKQIRYLFGGLLFLFASTGSVTAQEVSDYSKTYNQVIIPALHFHRWIFFSRTQKALRPMN